MSNTRKFDTIKVNKQGGLTLSFDQTGVAAGGTVVQDTFTNKSDRPLNKQLTDLFSQLIPHLVFACEIHMPTNYTREWFTDGTYLDDPRLEKYKVTGVKLIGKEDLDGVKLIGQIETSNGEVVSIITPIIYFDDQQDFPYALRNILHDQIEDLKTLADGYMTNKYAQLELSF